MKDNTIKPLLTADVLKARFEEGLGFIMNKNNIEFELHPSGQVIATLNLCYNTAHTYSLDLLADYDNLEQFIEANQLRSVKDMELIGASALWIRYLGGNGYVCCDLEEFDAEVCFRIVKSITTVYSADMAFYEEVSHVMSLTAQFAEYIEQNMMRLGAVAVMRMAVLPERPFVPGLRFVE